MSIKERQPRIVQAVGEVDVSSYGSNLERDPALCNLVSSNIKNLTGATEEIEPLWYSCLPIRAHRMTGPNGYSFANAYALVRLAKPITVQQFYSVILFLKSSMTYR
jgi:hypothetical protein